VKTFENIFSRFDTMPECDGQTDGHMSTTRKRHNPDNGHISCTLRHSAESNGYRVEIVSGFRKVLNSWNDLWGRSRSSEIRLFD